MRFFICVLCSTWCMGIIMLKGVNKNVIEISDTGDDLFERAILFLRPQCPGDDGHIRMRAANFLTGLSLRRGIYSSGTFMGAIKLMSAAIAGATVTMVVFALVH